MFGKCWRWNVRREFTPFIVLAEKAFGISRCFMEVYSEFERALSGGPNRLYLKDLERLIAKLTASWSI